MASSGKALLPMILLGGGAAALIVATQKKASAAPTGTAPGGTPSTAPKPATPGAAVAPAGAAPLGSTQPTVRKGNTGAAVKTLQLRLNQLGFYPGTIDGVFGTNTETALKNFQRSKALAIDGIAGPNTWKALGYIGSGATASVSPAASPTTSPASLPPGLAPATSPLLPTASAPAPAALPAPTSLPILKNGSSGQLVTNLQTRLVQLGFPPGAIDGKYGPGTASAVAKFQAQRKLSTDGVVGPQTWAELMKAVPATAATAVVPKPSPMMPAATVPGVPRPSAMPAAPPPAPVPGPTIPKNTPALRNGSKGENVKTLQLLLNAKGFPVGTADGAFGPKTDAAVKAFQKSKGLTADGVVGPLTWGALGVRLAGHVGYMASALWPPPPPRPIY